MLRSSGNILAIIVVERFVARTSPVGTIDEKMDPNRLYGTRWLCLFEALDYYQKVYYGTERVFTKHTALQNLATTLPDRTGGRKCAILAHSV
jgi:hypothetical protein